jgi:predicted nucleic acid-binding protein
MVIKRKRITAAQGRDFLLQHAALDFKIAPPPQVSDFPRLHMLATIHQLTAYDADYLDLARRLSLPLATLDTALKAAAIAEGVQTL